MLGRSNFILVEIMIKSHERKKEWQQQPSESSSTRIVSWGFLRYVNEFLLAQAKPLLSLLIPLLHNLPTKSLFLFLLLSFPFFSSFDYNSLFFMLVCSSNNSLFFLFLSNVIFLFELNPFHQFFLLNCGIFRYFLLFEI